MCYTAIKSRVVRFALCLVTDFLVSFRFFYTRGKELPEWCDHILVTKRLFRVKKKIFVYFFPFVFTRHCCKRRLRANARSVVFHSLSLPSSPAALANYIRVFSLSYQLVIVSHTLYMVFFPIILCRWNSYRARAKHTTVRRIYYQIRILKTISNGRSRFFSSSFSVFF